MPHLTIPVEEVLDHAATFRVGPDRLPFDLFVNPPWPVSWAAYWYRDHSRCAPPACRCWDYAREDRKWAFAGEGIVLVAYKDGFFGIYPLLHAYDESPLIWAEIAQHHSRLTSEEMENLRTGPFAFGLADGSALDLPAAVNTVWAAWDAGVTRHGLPPFTDGTPAEKSAMESIREIR